MGTRKVWAALNGFVCLYKPVELSTSGLKKIIVKRICSDGNALVLPKPLPTIKVPLVEPHKSGALVVVGDREQQDYMLHPLVSGEAFRTEDLRIEELSYMESSSSGVCVFGINEGCEQIPEILSRSLVNEYRLEGILGRETLKHEIKGKVTLKAAYDHVTRHRMIKLLTRVQAHYRKSAFESAEVDLQSEKAFELARKGIPRAKLPGAQLIYKIDLDSFDPPYFALNIQAVGETDSYLRCFVHEIGVSLGTTASCLKLQRKSLGPFWAEHALLDKQISLQNIVRNMSLCKKLLSLEEDKDLLTETSETEGEVQRDIVDCLGLSQSFEDFDAMRPAWPRKYE
ncbi:unnamed protein product [Auanema sp. JU1783]|nr:unnamed protein product [Auanema sp. JU1783]